VARHLDHQKEVIAIIGVLSDKSLEALIAPLSAVVTRWIAVDLPTERAYAATDMAAVLHAAAALVTTAVSPQAATKALMAEKDGQKLVIAYGSFYTVAGVLPVLDAWRGTVES
jgi:dihydrofolate synthase/folylpolyglutamate synthase